jgi:hypothetical protein
MKPPRQSELIRARLQEAIERCQRAHLKAEQLRAQSAALKLAYWIDPSKREAATRNGSEEFDTTAREAG